MFVCLLMSWTTVKIKQNNIIIYNVQKIQHRVVHVKCFIITNNMRQIDVKRLDEWTKVWLDEYVQTLIIKVDGYCSFCCLK